MNAKWGGDHLLKVERGTKKRIISLCTAVQSLGNKKNACWVSTGKPERKGPLGKSVTRLLDNIKTNPKGAPDSSKSREGQGAGSCEYEASGSIPWREHVLLRNCQLLKKNSAPWGCFVISGLLTTLMVSTLKWCNNSDWWTGQGHKRSGNGPLEVITEFSWTT